MPVKRRRNGPKPGRPPANARSQKPPSWLLEDWEKAIEPVDEACSVNPGASTCPQDRRTSLIKIAIYRMVRELRSKKRLSLIESIVGFLEYEPKVIKFDANPFHWAIYAIDRNEELYRKPGRRTKSSMLDIGEEPMNRLAYQLLYADRHEVPPELLIGFIYQTASSTRAKKNIRNNSHEPWLTSYLAAQNAA